MVGRPEVESHCAMLDTSSIRAQERSTNIARSCLDAVRGEGVLHLADIDIVNEDFAILVGICGGVVGAGLSSNVIRAHDCRAQGQEAEHSEDL